MPKFIEMTSHFYTSSGPTVFCLSPGASPKSTFRRFRSGHTLYFSDFFSEFYQQVGIRQSVKRFRSGHTLLFSEFYFPGFHNSEFYTLTHTQSGRDSWAYHIFLYMYIYIYQLGMRSRISQLSDQWWTHLNIRIAVQKHWRSRTCTGSTNSGAAGESDWG